MHHYLVDMLVCPACHGDLAWTVSERDQHYIETAEARCTDCEAVYPVRQGIGLFLTPDLPRNDLWSQVDSGLIQYLREHPAVERQLLDAPPESLAPADQFFRVMVLETHGEYTAAAALEELANSRIYTQETLACHKSQIQFVLERLSGPGGLAIKLARDLNRPVVVTDFSPLVLKHNRRRLEFLKLHEWVSLLAFDARRTPFKSGAIPTLTTNLGLPNIHESGNLLRELRRVVAGTFLAVSHFYPDDDQTNREASLKHGIGAMLFRESALAQFVTSNWQVEVANVCTAPARPTPKSALFEGATIDALPVAETVLEWCVLVAH